MLRWCLSGKIQNNGSFGHSRDKSKDVNTGHGDVSRREDWQCSELVGCSPAVEDEM